MMRARIPFLLFVALLLAGCGSFNSGAVRDLSAAEIDVLNDTRTRLVANQADVDGSLDDLYDNVEFAVGQQHRLDSNIAKAQLLEAMKSPWSTTRLESTQKEVVLYHLYALEDAEHKALQSRLDARRTRIDQLKTSYARLLSGMGALISVQQQLLASLDQPAAMQINLVLQQALAESAAFRKALDGSDDPRLERAVADLAQAEQAVSETAAQILGVLERLEQE